MNTKKHISIRIILVTLMLVMGLSFTGMFSAGIAHADEPAAVPAADTGNGGAGNGGAGNNLAAGQLGNTTIGDITKGDDIIVGLSKILAIGLRAISQLIWPLLMFGSGLLKSDFLYTGAIDIKLTEMWIQVRNLVNIIYVILLLAVALYNVLGLGETVDFLEIKKALPKIILGLLLVNFSYAGVKVVLDVVNVGTTFAFSLPRTDPELNLQTQAIIASASKNMCMNSDVEKIAKSAEQSTATKPAGGKDKAPAPDSYQGQLDACMKLKGASAQQACKDKVVASSKKGICIGDELGNKTLNPEVKKLLSDWNIDGALTIMAVKFMRMQDLSQIAAKLKDNVTISNLAINMLFSLVLYLVYGISFIVLIVVLFARAAVLWMVIVFSPLIVVNMTFPNLVSQLGGGAGDAAGKIIKTLIAPIIIGFVLSIGYILLSTMQNVNYDGIGSLISDVPTSNLDTFQDFMIAIGSVVFVWMGIEGAISGTIGESVSNMVMSAAKDAGGWLAKAPFYYTPLFQIKSPHGTHSETVSMGTLAKALDIAKSTPENHAHEEAVRIFGNKGGLSEIAKKEQLNEFMKGKDSAYFLENEENRNNLKKAIDKIKSTEGLKDSEPADHQLLLLKKELDKGDKLNRVAADNALREYKKRKGISDVAETPGKAGGEGGGGTTSGTVTASTDKTALKDGSKHLIDKEKQKAEALINAGDEASFEAAKKKDADAAVLANQALAIHNMKDALRKSAKMKEYAEAVEKGDAAKIQAAADAIKPEIEAFITSLAEKGGFSSTNGAKQAEILGEVFGELGSKNKGKMATVTAEQIKRIFKDKTELGNNIAGKINK